MAGRPRAGAPRAVHQRCGLGRAPSDERRPANRPRAPATGAGRHRPACPHRRRLAAPRRRRCRLFTPRAHLHHVREGPPPARRRLPAALRRGLPGVRRPRSDRRRRPGAAPGPGQGLREPGRPRAPEVPGPLRARRVPDGPQAVRGSGAPLRVHGEAPGHPRQDPRAPELRGVVRGAPDARSARHELLRRRPRRGQDGRRPPRPQGLARADVGPTGLPVAVPVTVGLALRPGHGRRGRRLLPLRRQAPPLPPRRGRRETGELHRGSRGDRDVARDDRRPPRPVPRRDGRCHGGAGAIERRDGGRLPRQPARHAPGLCPHTRAPVGGVSPRGPADPDARHARGQPLLVDGRHHGSGRAPVDLLGDVHLDRRRHRGRRSS